ncbi:glyoxalase/bleomycin resistance/dioxygenase family protein [Paenibacillus sp. 5J-6]|uniref:Glyoxalase/bleomycin resistance/dioxygenase family protein n=1 Tax=Paenibacillus silvestris TaxID=2606219 RepID=A0A6L8VAI3_9BACL|nr:VOC family protein [Paenibacillus silvestris]MZQ86220.1 glyoxalase/bleomycin resistance/dioxygenase family protein [Paenibacillus silvestris]
MNIRETGIILFCEDYDSALKFYSEKLGLNIRRRGEGLSILDFGGSYLMIESNGVASNREKTRAENPIVIRFNVNNFDSTVSELKARGVKVDVKKFDWGIIGIVIDPEGNRIEIKD